MNLHNVIKYPLLTEKSSQKFDQGVYTFAVDKKTNKAEVKHVVEFIFNVKVAKVNISTIRKKPKKLGKFAGFKSGYKKAVVTLLEGYSIQLFSDKATPPSEVELSKTQSESQKSPSQISDVEKRAAEKIAAKAQLKQDKTNIAEENAKNDQDRSAPSDHKNEEK